MERAGIRDGDERLRHLAHFVPTAGVPTNQTAGGPLLYVGRLSHEKGVDVLLTAMSMLHRPASLIVAGDGPERDALTAQAADLGLHDVQFVGQVPKSRVEDLLRAALAMVLPARWHENQPMSILEAFAAGLPVVSTAVGGITELIDNGVDGRVVPHDDAAALADALAEFIDAPDMALTAGANARRKVEVQFAPRRHLDGLRSLYQEAGA
jgi:glycosyltransferase involved in cell wall biosynthesis